MFLVFYICRSVLRPILELQKSNEIELNSNIVRDLKTVLRECNIFAHPYQMMNEELRAQQVLNGTDNESEL